MPSNHLILCHTLLLPSSIFLASRISIFSNESVLCIRWPKYWSFSFIISVSNEHPGLISFRMDWLDLLAVQGTLKSLLQYYSSKASILWCSAFFRGFLGGARGKELAYSEGDIREMGLIPGSRRSPGGGHGNPLQYSCLENPMDCGAW